MDLSLIDLPWKQFVNQFLKHCDSSPTIDRKYSRENLAKGMASKFKECGKYFLKTLILSFRNQNYDMYFETVSKLL